MRHLKVVMHALSVFDDCPLYTREVGLIIRSVFSSSILTSWFSFSTPVLFSLRLILVIYQLTVSIVFRMLVTKDGSGPLLVLHFLLPVVTGIYYAVSPLISGQTRRQHHEDYWKKFLREATVWIRVTVLVAFVRCPLYTPTNVLRCG